MTKPFPVQGPWPLMTPNCEARTISGRVWEEGRQGETKGSLGM